MLLSSAYETLTRAGMLSADEQAALNRVDPLAETAFLMMAADGSIRESELDAIRGAIRSLTNQQLRSGTIQVMLETYQRNLIEQGREARLREIAEQLAEDSGEAEGAFALAAAVALADDEVCEEEIDFLNQLAEWLGISSDRANQLLDQLGEDRSRESE